MPSTAAIVKDQELVSFGLVESASVNSFADFQSSNLNKSAVNAIEENNDFSNIFICHLIFYAFFCLALVLHLLIDLGLGAFLKNKFSHLIGFGIKNISKRVPVFA